MVRGAVAGYRAFADRDGAVAGERAADQGQAAAGVVAGDPVVGDAAVADVQLPGGVGDAAAVAAGDVAAHRAVAQGQPAEIFAVDPAAALAGLVAGNRAVADVGHRMVFDRNAAAFAVRRQVAADGRAGDVQDRGEAVDAAAAAVAGPVAADAAGVERDRGDVGGDPAPFIAPARHAVADPQALEAGRGVVDAKHPGAAVALHRHVRIAVVVLVAVDDQRVGDRQFAAQGDAAGSPRGKQAGGEDDLVRTGVGVGVEHGLPQGAGAAVGTAVHREHGRRSRSGDQGLAHRQGQQAAPLKQAWSVSLSHRNSRTRFRYPWGPGPRIASRRGTAPGAPPCATASGFR